MDFADLSKYDDLCSDVFLDALFLWFKTSKMNSDHRRPRIPSNKVLDIIQRRVQQERNPNEAIAELLEIDYFRHYITSKSPKQRQEFVQHMKRYLYMYMPNAGYEISDTRRYKDHGKKVEACLIATKDWHVGDELRLCTGMIANLNPNEDAMLRKGEKDFSIMWSTRKGCSCLFLGPARFVNHDCDSNCKFISLGQNSITFKVVKEIKCGEELTVFYGNHYFGEDNNECRCATCELHGEGYFSLHSSTTTSVEEESAVAADGRRRSSRKRKSALHDDYVSDHIPRAAKRTTTTERRNSSSVMSIDFLCGREQEEQGQQQQQQGPCLPPPTQATSPLDLLCDAVLDAENNNKLMTVLVGPTPTTTTSSKDTTAPSAVSISMYYQQESSSSSSPLSDDLSSNSDTKADSAVGMSPHSHGCWKEEELDDQSVPTTATTTTTMSGFLPKQDGLDGDDGLSDFLDDQSDLSSIGSSELAEADWSDDDDDDDDDADEEDDHSNVNNNNKRSNNNNNNSKKRSNKPSFVTTANGHGMDANKKLTCIACKRELRREEISEQVGCDTSITADLVTWTWTPSALFTDWRPKRCPRCERHFTLFAQEWPNRKGKKKKKPAAAAVVAAPSASSADAATSITATEAGDAKPKKNKKQQQSKKKSRMTGQQQEKEKKKTKKKTKAKTKATALPPLKIDMTDVFNNDDLFSPLLTPLSDFSGDEDELFNVPL